MIDLRSDTVTRPTAGHARRHRRSRRRRRADAGGPDGQRAAGARRRRCSARSARSSCRRRRWRTRSRSSCTAGPGDVLIAEEHSHVVVYEFGGAAVHAGLAHRRPAGHGRAADAGAGARGDLDRRGRGRPAPCRARAREHAQRRRRARLAARRARRRSSPSRARAGVGVHMDGARLLNAAVALGVPPAAIGSRVDTVTLCLSKGLGCPLGAILAGPGRPDGGGVAPEVPLRRRDAAGGDRSRRRRSTPSTTTSSGSRSTTRGRAGSPRAGTQPGCRSSSTGSRRTSSRSTPRRLDLPRAEVLAALREAGVALSPTYGPSHIRAVTHLDLDDADIDRALELVPETLAVRRRLSRLAASRPSDATEQIASAELSGRRRRRTSPRRRRRRRSGSTPRSRDETPPQIVDHHDRERERRARRSRPCGSRARAGRSATRAATTAGIRNTATCADDESAISAASLILPR